jgi:D-glycero-alpha-D-manno-heptose-7-phosphate kinase
MSTVLIARAPLHISFGGDGTDLPAYYEQHGGLVVSATISYYAYAILTPSRLDDVQIIFANHRAIHQQSTCKDLIWDRGLRLLKAIACYFHVDGGVTIFLASQVPPCAGLGCFSSVAVTMIKALAFWCGLDLGPAEVAELACHIAIDKMKMPIGKQEQYAAAFGGLNCIRFSSRGVVVEPLEVSRETREALERGLMLFFAGDSLHSESILYREEQASCEDERTTFARLDAIEGLGSEIHVALKKGDMVAFGELLHESWMKERELTQDVTNEFMDQCYRAARDNGAMGGKVTGAGGGEYMVFYCPEEHQAAVTDALATFGLQRQFFWLGTDGVQIMEVSSCSRAPMLRMMPSHRVSERSDVWKAGEARR